MVILKGFHSAILMGFRKDWQREKLMERPKAILTDFQTGLQKD